MVRAGYATAITREVCCSAPVLTTAVLVLNIGGARHLEPFSLYELLQSTHSVVLLAFRKPWASVGAMAPMVKAALKENGRLR